MNRKQRISNKENAKKLYQLAKEKRLAEHICENCGEPGGHWVQTRGWSLEALVSGVDDQQGFWTCSKYYGEDGRRLPEHTEDKLTNGAIAAVTMVSLLSGL